MKRLSWSSHVYLAMALSAILYSGTAVALSGGAGGGLEGQPPHGLAISDNAPGTKLTGVMMIEYVNFDSGADSAEMARVVLRLSRGEDSKMGNDPKNQGKKEVETYLFYGEIPGPLHPRGDPLSTQYEIMLAMTGDVLDAFFPGESVQASVKRLKPFYSIDTGGSFLPRDAIAPGYGTCQYNVLACDPIEDAPWCDPGNPDLYITTCQGTYEFCANDIDDDGDLKVDRGERHPGIADPDCDSSSAFAVTGVEIAVK